MQQFKKDESTAARRRFYVHLVDATDGMTVEVGESGGQPQISKNGAAFGNTSATLTSIGNGAYYVELSASELDTLGVILVRYKSANTTEFQDIGYVLANDMYAATTVDLTGIEASLTAIQAKTDNLPTDPADESLIIAAIAASSPDFTAVLNAIAAAHLATDALIAALGLKVPDDLGDVPTLTELNTAHGVGSWVMVGGGSGGAFGLIDTVSGRDEKAKVLKSIAEILTLVKALPAEIPGKLKEPFTKFIDSLTMLEGVQKQLATTIDAGLKEAAATQLKALVEATKEHLQQVDGLKDIILKALPDDALEDI